MGQRNDALEFGSHLEGRRHARLVDREDVGDFGDAGLHSLNHIACIGWDHVPVTGWKTMRDGEVRGAVSALPSPDITALAM